MKVTFSFLNSSLKWHSLFTFRSVVKKFRKILNFINTSIYNIISWFAGPMGQTNHWASVWCSKYFFSIASYRLRALKNLYFYFCNFIKKIKKKNWNDFCRELCKILWKNNNTWNVRQLVDKLFVPLAQRTNVLYCRLTNFTSISLSRSIFNSRLLKSPAQLCVPQKKVNV